MPALTTVSNTSPLFYLHQLGQVQLLHRLYGRVLVPAAVRAELERGGQGGHSVPDLAQYPWLEVVDVELPDGFKSRGLGDGESHAVALALQQSSPRIILDERAARRWAEELGLAVVGTVGVLIRAKREGHLDYLRPSLEALVQSGFRLHPTVAAKALQLVGEA